MKHQLETKKTRVSLKSTLIGFSMISALALFGQEWKIILPNSTQELHKNSSEVFNHINPDGTSGRIPVNYQKEVQTYSVTDIVDNSYCKYSSYQVAVDIIQSQQIDVADAKFGENNAIYLCTEFNIGNYLGGDISLNYIYKGKYSFKIGHSENVRIPESQPEDYIPGIGLIFFRRSADPLDQFNNFQIMAGRIYEIENDITIRLNISIGLGYTILTEPENWKKIDPGIFDDNYTWDYKKHGTISLIINPKIEYPFTRIYGLTFSPMLQINKDRIYYGIGIGQMIGLLRKRKN
jgi:hypothetical protein